MTYAFTLDIAPKPKALTRFGNGRTYTPPETVRFEREVAMLARKHAPPAPLKGAISMAVTFMLARPQRKRLYPAVRPDLDNFTKAVTDALEGIFYVNDWQIVRLTVEKTYAGPSGPAIYVELKEL
jgi:Holliday junction resolvase RusA-like endonuclease